MSDHAWVHDRRRVQLPFGRLKRLGEELGPLPVVPGSVVAADRVVVGYGAAQPDQRLGGRLLDRGPLLELGAGPAGRNYRVVGSRSVGIDVREAARDEAAPALVGQSPPSGSLDSVVRLAEPIPGDGRLERLL